MPLFKGMQRYRNSSKDIYLLYTSEKYSKFAGYKL